MIATQADRARRCQHNSICVHALVTGGALSSDGKRWIAAKRGFLFPVRALSKVFRGKYLDALRQAFEQGELRFAGQTTPLTSPKVFALLLAKLRAENWVVYSKRPFAGPEQVLAYLGRYTHRVAISNERLLRLEQGTGLLPVARLCAWQ